MAGFYGGPTAPTAPTAPGALSAPGMPSVAGAMAATKRLDPNVLSANSKPYVDPSRGIYVGFQPESTPAYTSPFSAYLGRGRGFSFRRI